MVQRSGYSPSQRDGGLFPYPLRVRVGGIVRLAHGLAVFQLSGGGQRLDATITLGISFGTGLWQYELYLSLLAPLITMRLFAEERKCHTLDLLLRSRLGHGQIIVAKFLSSLMTVLFLLSLTLIFPIILAVSGYSNWPMVFSGYGGVILCVMCYLAVGLFTSSLTENQILASLAGFVFYWG